MGEDGNAPFGQLPGALVIACTVFLDRILTSNLTTVAKELPLIHR